MLTHTPTKNSFQWMLHAGVSATDVAWLERMNGSQDLHIHHQKRVENIFTAAAEGVLTSQNPAAVILLSLN